MSCASIQGVIDRGAGPDAASCTGLAEMLTRVGTALDAHAEAPPYDTEAYPGSSWAGALDVELPVDGWGRDRVVELLTRVVVAHGMPADQGGFCGWIFTAAPTVPVVAQAVGARVGAQRYMHFANGLLENVALDWIARAFGLPDDMEGVFTSGGSVANLLGLMTARQHALDAVGIDASFSGLAHAPPLTIYGSEESHHCVIKSAAALGVGRANVRLVPTDARHRIDVRALARAIADDRAQGFLPIAVVGAAGSTNTGAIDPLDALADLCGEESVWLHVDGAYGLPGVLDDRVRDRFAGIERADSVCTDLHKWLNVPTGTGVTYVRPKGLLERTLTGEPSPYIEGQFAGGRPRSGWDAMGPPFHEMSLELSASSRGMVAWAALAEIGVSGFADRVRRHRDCAWLVHEAAREHPRLQSLIEPELSVACLRYVGQGLAVEDLDAVNAAILARLRADGTYAPSGTMVDGVFAIRPCFVSAWSQREHAVGLVDAIIAVGDELCVA